MLDICWCVSAGGLWPFMSALYYQGWIKLGGLGGLGCEEELGGNWAPPHQLWFLCLWLFTSLCSEGNVVLSLCESSRELCDEMEEKREKGGIHKRLKVVKRWAGGPFQRLQNTNFHSLLPLLTFSHSFSFSFLCLDAESCGLSGLLFLPQQSELWVTMETGSGSCAGTGHDGRKREEEEFIWKGGGREGGESQRARGGMGGVSSPSVEERNRHWTTAWSDKIRLDKLLFVPQQEHLHYYSRKVDRATLQ